jgi:SAM-dependent methyltransferase
VPGKRSATVTDETSSRDRLLRPPRNLDFLLTRRTQFIRNFLSPGADVLEVGAGLGVMALYVRGVNLVTTDVRPKPWIDVAVDAQALPFLNESFDAAVALHVLHHVPSPRQALSEMVRVLRPGGLLLVAEPVASAAVKATLALSRHEYIDGSVDPFTSDRCQTHASFPGGGNNAIGDVLFGNLPRFLSEFPSLDLRHDRYVEFITFLNSGGVSVQGPSIPLPKRGRQLFDRIDTWLMRYPRIFAMSRELVFQKATA